MIAVLAAALVAGACSTRSGRSTATVEVPGTLPAASEPEVEGSCLLTVGEGEGAEVTDTIPGSAGADTFTAGDVIVQFGGDPIPSSAQLVRSVNRRQIGDTIEVLLASGESRTLTLRENPEAAGQAQLGVLVTTLEDRTALDDVPVGDLDGGLVRVVQLDDRLWLFDPVTTSWRSLGVDAPPNLWVSLSGEVYGLSLDLELGGARITPVIEGAGATVDLGEWQPDGLFTTLDDALLLGTSRLDPDGSRAYGIAAIDPSTATVRWAWGMPADADTRTTPSFGFRSPSGSKNLIALTLENDLTQIRYLVMRDTDGSPDAVLGVFPEDFVAVGWSDESHVAGIVPPAIDELVLVDIEDGTTSTLDIGLSSVPVGLWPVGDGSHIVIEDGMGLLQIEIGGPGRRRLSAGCPQGLLSETGW